LLLLKLIQEAAKIFARGASLVVFIAFVGFQFSAPFMPLYVRELGVTDPAQVALWSGLLAAVTPAVSGLLAPVFGRLADRFGRKMMLIRSLAGFTVIIAAMGLVTSVHQLLIARIVQGLFAGFSPMAMAVASVSAPRDKVSVAIARVQGAQLLSVAVGPAVGGVVASRLGIRPAFFVTAGLCAVSLIALIMLFREAEPLERGEIYDANGLILTAQIRSTGATVERMPPVKDDAESTRAAIERGLEAIDRIRTITAGRFTFSDTVVDRVASADLPATSDLLSLLAGNGSASTVPSAPNPPARPPDTAPRPAAPAPPQAGTSPELVKAQAVIEAELTEFVGPIAPLLCRGHITKAAAAGPPLDLPALVEAVAREIGDRAKEDRFKQQALARLRER
jgi:MFS family permease